MPGPVEIKCPVVELSARPLANERSGPVGWAVVRQLCGRDGRPSAISARIPSHLRAKPRVFSKSPWAPPAKDNAEAFGRFLRSAHTHGRAHGRAHRGDCNFIYEASSKARAPRPPPPAASIRRSSRPPPPPPPPRPPHPLAATALSASRANFPGRDRANNGAPNEPSSVPPTLERPETESSAARLSRSSGDSVGLPADQSDARDAKGRIRSRVRRSTFLFAPLAEGMNAARDGLFASAVRGPHNGLGFI
jgi:hypothetical protein